MLAGNAFEQVFGRRVQAGREEAGFNAAQQIQKTQVRVGVWHTKPL
jgi:hypothetical protein